MLFFKLTSALLTSLVLFTAIPAAGQKKNLQDAREVYHTGDSLWIGTDLLPDHFLASVPYKKAEVILSLSTHKTSGKQYLMVVNRSFKVEKRLTVQFITSVKKVGEISKITGKPVKSSFDVHTHAITESFLRSEGKLYTLN